MPQQFQAGQNSTRAVLSFPDNVATAAVADSSDSVNVPVSSTKCVHFTDLYTIKIIVLLQEILAAQAHDPPHGAKTKRFETVAITLNNNVEFSIKVYAKRVRDRYELLQRHFNRKNWKDAIMSGVGGELTNVDELLSVMQDLREEVTIQERQESFVVQEQEQEQSRLTAGVQVVRKGFSKWCGEIWQ